MQKLESLLIFYILKFLPGTKFYLTTMAFRCNKKLQIPLQTTNGRVDLFISRRRAYYHSYQNPPHVILCYGFSVWACTIVFDTL